MSPDPLRIHSRPSLENGRLLLAFSGWMDGGDVSTGTVEWLVNTLDAPVVAEIDPEPYYIYNFPGSMDVSAQFRPHTKIEDGLIVSYTPPTNAFFCTREQNLLMFSGKEPNFQWRSFAGQLFSFATQCGISEILFVGSVGSAIPHTREPRLLAAVSDERLKPILEPYVSSFSEYEGPASFTTYLMTEAGARDMRMAALVAEVPAYIQGTNPKSIESVVRKLAAMLGVQVNLDRLRGVTDAWEARLNRLLETEEELAQHIHKLEEDYDNEVFDTQMEDLKEWLQKKGIRID